VTGALLDEMHAHDKLPTDTGSLLYQDWRRFAISRDIFFSRLLRKKLARFPEGYAQMKAEIERVRSLLNPDLDLSLFRAL
jgi:hypothetical protein